MSLAEYLTSSFLTAKNRVAWTDLSGAVVGGLLYQLWAGVIQLPIAFGAAIKSFFAPILTAVGGGVEELSGTIVAEAAATWDPFRWGVVSLAVNTLVLLIAMFIVARAIEVMRSG